MLTREAVEAIVREQLGAVAGARVPAHGVDPDTPWGEDGLGLDSIEIAEALIACEDELGVSIGEVLEHGPVTLVRVVDKLAGG